ncbi:DUF4350 domain-containing protein [Massilia glaciei]|uniref:DUF4350 domain-containing protein n=1 Tax=Massilia glaciei TaxID=1524097 RepID=A0A2U2HIQ5_9BURK|nr:DUF4350 domain-containing protein [Massilia glaciei]PWF46675.1 DUF4350 domain-containing protein [Massilia glaciei]
MTPGAKKVFVAIVAAGAAALVALGWWWWHQIMEQRMVAHWTMSEAAAENPMLAATMFLRQQKIAVDIAPKLANLPLRSLRDGTIIIAESDGLVTQAQSGALLAWVAKGNTLVMRPRHFSKSDGVALQPDAGGRPDPKREAEKAEEAEEAAEEVGDRYDDAPAAADAKLVESDPIGKRYGVRIMDWSEAAPRCGGALEPLPAAVAAAGRKARTEMRLACMRAPGAGWPLELDTDGHVLVSLQGRAVKPLWADRAGEGVRVFAEGRGHVVLVPTNYFDNQELERYDHAEALLALVRLNPRAARVLIVQHVDVLPWYRALWNNFALAVLGAALLLALLLWVALRRFGPLLPAPRAERRSLVEHIDASAAWLWHAQGGRALLIDAVRDDALAALARRAPELQHLAPPDKLRMLAARSGLPQAELDKALYWLAGHTSQEFTLQIQTLQALRKHFDE